MESHDVPIHSGKGNMVENSLVRNVVTDKKKQGWGIRPTWGKLYGETFIEEYTNELKEMFDVGEKNKVNKMGPAVKHEQLKRNHPESPFSLPGENVIRRQISKLMATANSVPKEDGKGRGSKLFPDAMRSLVQSELLKNPVLKPKAGLALVKEKFPDTELGDSQTRSLISQLKTKAKKDDTKSLMQ
mmetsp:Transcript_3896/g.8597  ORF Transcript_3896/g.8597 Transcript_3896/m.8597 type:complete len:186 (-) Transcript_3896:1393-1950(-)